MSTFPCSNTARIYSRFTAIPRVVSWHPDALEVAKEYSLDSCLPGSQTYGRQITSSSSSHRKGWRGWSQIPKFCWFQGNSRSSPIPPLVFRISCSSFTSRNSSPEASGILLRQTSWNKDMELWIVIPRENIWEQNIICSPGDNARSTNGTRTNSLPSKARNYLRTNMPTEFLSFNAKFWCL